MLLVYALELTFLAIRISVLATILFGRNTKMTFETTTKRRGGRKTPIISHILDRSRITQQNIGRPLQSSPKNILSYRFSHGGSKYPMKMISRNIN